ncbi:MULTISPECIES: PDZ domain-containing protein [Geobacillus]|uniref:Membrane protein, putative n=1 Tax=Geobacillus thermodenitrificans (strain NG80-2) TaxID=420246 RepID=A4ISS9_GEOTN|nr:MULTISPECIES: PDZ domain-containing protein [Geobacillus]ABO68383.1 Membrane protein, putative [Geobacillus thermodenitrificans NG80-2]ARA98496.1 signal protein PDZ [Geobacillus thermodenitrificans]NNU86174.1 PDZ domain-containing protein [Geobacillus sp. MR]
MATWGLELLEGIAAVWRQPLLYYGVLLAIVAGWRRVKRERRDFHVRVHHPWQEWRGLWTWGWAAGAVLSVVAISAGVALPREAVWMVTALTVVIGFTMEARLLSPAYTVGGAIVLLGLIGQSGMVSDLFPDGPTAGAALALFLTLLLAAEGWLILRSQKGTASPQLVKSKRGMTIGMQWTQRFWFVPIVLPVSGGALSPVSWWPLLPAGDGYSFWLVPFLLGFSQRRQHVMPPEAAHEEGRRVLRLALLVALLAVVGIWYLPLAFVAGAVAIIGREWIAFSGHRADRARPPRFARHSQGVVIVGVLPGSKAEKMGLQIGEIIMKANGVHVRTEAEFYEELQRNRAFCKLDVIGHNGEVRFVQGALYEDEHHELGLLFVHNRGASASEAVS